MFIEFKSGMSDLAIFYCFFECFESQRWRIIKKIEEDGSFIVHLPKALAVNSNPGDSKYCA